MCTGDIWLLVRWRNEGSHSVVQGKNVVSQEAPYMEGQFVVKDAKRTYDAEVLYAGMFVVIIIFVKGWVWLASCLVRCKVSTVVQS